MNVNNLSVGQIIKSYRQLCEILGIKSTGGDSKKAQMKELARFVDYHKEGNKIIIDDIYNEPLERIETRGGSKSIYEDDIQALILHECSISEMEEYNSIKLSCVGLANKLSIINNNYVLGRNHINKFSDYLNVPVEIIYDFYDSTQRKNKSIIENSLNKLKDKALIKWYKILRIRTSEGNYKDATDREINIIAEIEQEALEFLCEESKQAVFLKRKWNDFNKKVSELLYEYETSIDYYFEAYKISVTEKFKTMMLDAELYAEITSRLNSNIINSEFKSCVKRHQKVVDYANAHNFEPIVGFDYYFDEFNKMNEKGFKFKSDKARFSETYIDDTKKIIDICINKNSKVNLGFELVNTVSSEKENSELPF